MLRLRSRGTDDGAAHIAALETVLDSSQCRMKLAVVPRRSTRARAIVRDMFAPHSGRSTTAHSTDSALRCDTQNVTGCRPTTGEFFVQWLALIAKRAVAARATS